MKRIKSKLGLASLTAVAAVALSLGSVLVAESAVKLNTASGGYVVCISKKDQTVKMPLKASCPGGYLRKIIGAKGTTGARGLQGYQGAQGAQGAIGPAGPAGPAPVTSIDSIIVPAGDFRTSNTTTVGEKIIAGWPHEVLTVPAGTTAYAFAPIEIPTSWKTAQSLTVDLYYTTTTDNTSTWTLEHGLDGFAAGDVFATDTSTETTVTPANLGPDKIQKVTYTEFIPKRSLSEADIFEMILGRWSTAENLNMGDIYIISLRITPQF